MAQDRRKRQARAQRQKNALATAERVCAREGLRLTPTRRRVLQLIWAAGKPAKAYELLEKLGAGASGKPPVVYRALDFLLAAGLVHRVSVLNAYVGCNHPLKHASCHLLVCSECGDARECCAGALESAVNSTVRDNSFELDRTVIEISGRCARCRRKAR